MASPERSIVDSLDDSEQPEQIELAIQQALSRGLTTRHRLRGAAARRSKRVREVVDDTTYRYGVKYTTAPAFRRALEDRLKARVGGDGPRNCSPPRERPSA